MKYLILVLLSFSAIADNPHNYGTQIITIEPVMIEPVVYDPVINLEPVVYETQVNTIIEQYIDNCRGVALSQAGANNAMYMGTDKPQLSLGVGECNGDFATSLMVGGRINKQLFINGSWAKDENTNAFGAGITAIFK